MSAVTETLAFQAETKALLRLVTHSLYTEKDIFLRELISNASDALDRLRFESLTNHELLEGNDKFEIRLDVDRAGRTLTISDSGVGMTREQVIANIGTIAKSGTDELRRLMEERGTAGDAAALIGQFGVGFYSAFMVADRVKLVTRPAGGTTAVEWESEGDGTYSIREAEKPERGTSITLYLKKPDPETEMQDFTDYWRLSTIVKKHSDFIAYPIILKKEREQKDDPKEVVIEDNTINSMKPLWTRTPSEVKTEDYNEFYKHISNDWTEPLRVIHFRAEGTFEYDALLYIPAKAPYDLFYQGSEKGLRLFAKRVMIMEKCEDLLPHYLRFIKGVVDARDLPLNVSRQRLQQDHHISRMRKRLTTKVLDLFVELSEKNHDQYLELWKEFGRALKEGVSSDYENKDRLIPLLLYASSHDPKELTTLKDYVARMTSGQEQIYYMTGDSVAMIENSPHLEAIREKGYEVLYMVEPVDELVLQHLFEFDGKKLKSVGKGAIELGTDEEKESAKKELESKKEEFKALIAFLEKELGDHIKEVRISTRLTSSPVCLVVGDHEYSPMLERALHKGQVPGPKSRRVLELNPKHALISRMQARIATAPEDPFLPKAAAVLLGLAQISEGSELADPVLFGRAAGEILAQAM